MKVTLNAWSERIRGITWYCVAVNGPGVFEIFDGKSRSSQQAYDRAEKLALNYIQQQGYELETAL
jgi:hypothetical protein